MARAHQRDDFVAPRVLFDLFKRLAIHPIQYGLVGVALAVFFLLLRSLSEHLSFGVSYCIAAAACIALLAVA